MSIPPTDSQGSDPAGQQRGLSRRAFVGRVAAATSMSLLAPWTVSAAAASKHVPGDFGSVRNSPRLPSRFTKTFRSRFVRPTESANTWSSVATDRRC
jgi:hypothetical protein